MNAIVGNVVAMDAPGLTDRAASFSYEDLIRCGHGQLFGPGNAQLPLPPMLMFDRITGSARTAASYGKGEIGGRTRHQARTSGSSTATSRATR